MRKNLKLSSLQPYPMGITRAGNSIRVCAAFESKSKCGIILYRENDRKGEKIEFSEEYRSGNIFSCEILGDTSEYKYYMLFCGKRLFCDPYAHYIEGFDKWAKPVDITTLRCRIDDTPYDWGSDKRPRRKYEDSFIYTLHVRGYTKSPSSGVELKKRGTYSGLCEKLPYIKSLGVTAIEIMPSYEMCVLDNAGPERTNGVNMPEGSISRVNTAKKVMVSEDGQIKDHATQRKKINFWGYKNGFYFAPRTAYAYSGSDADVEFKDMVKLFHKNGIEVIMQFYFDENASQDLMASSIRHWVFNYHIDGVHLKGNGAAPQLIAEDPALSDIKIWYYGFDYGKLYKGRTPDMRTLAEYQDQFMYSSRRFLKGDDNSLNDFIRLMLSNSQNAGIVNYICNYDGFRLCDLVSYEHKRNELNGENNSDGNPYNFSWNCGIEGKTRKQSILSLRNKQIKNALTMLFFSQGTPMLFGGDEFLNSQDGNNNPYCQDNATGWVDWKEASRPQGEALIEYVRFLSNLRFKYKILHESKPFKLMDYKACGYPDLSYHGTEAWRPDLSNYSHCIGMLYCGLYEQSDKEQDFFYVAYNMHWTPVSFALPKLPEGMQWKILNDTENTEDYKRMQTLKDQEKIECTERSVKILIGVGKPVTKTTKKRSSVNK